MILECGVGAQSAIRRVGVLGVGGRWKEEKGGRRRRWLTGGTPAKTTRGREEETHTRTRRRWLTGVITSETTRGREEKRGRCDARRKLQADPQGREEEEEEENHKVESCSR